MLDRIIDSSVIIDHLRGLAVASTYLRDLMGTESLATHPVAFAEVLGGARNLVEQKEIERLFSRFHLAALGESDVTASIDLFRRFRLSRGVGWLDSLIAATCIRHNVPVVTLNIKHFSAFPGLSVLRPY